MRPTPHREETRPSMLVVISFSVPKSHMQVIMAIPAQHLATSMTFTLESLLMPTCGDVDALLATNLITSQSRARLQFAK
jgi:hypothetical protein